MNSQIKRISRFWMEGGKLTEPPAERPVRTEQAPVEPHTTRLYCYGLDGETVHRFHDPLDLATWISEGDGRARVYSSDRRVKRANKQDDWPADEDEA